MRFLALSSPLRWILDHDSRGFLRLSSFWFAVLLPPILLSACIAQGRNTRFVQAERMEMYFSTWVEGGPDQYVRKCDLALETLEGARFDQLRILSWVDANEDGRRDPGEWSIVWESAFIEGGSVQLSLKNAILTRRRDKAELQAEEFIVEIDSGDGFEPVSADCTVREIH